MLVNATNISTLFTGWKSLFNQGLESAPSNRETLSVRVPSDTSEEKYGWLGQFPNMREWLGDRHIHSLAAHDYAIENRKFEMTISIDRTRVEDDRYGLYAPMFREMGYQSQVHPDELLFEVLAAGFGGDLGFAYDGQYFFDADHPVLDANGVAQSVSNVQSGVANAWVLIDASRMLKPFIWQERIPYDLQRLDKETDENVFMQDEFLYGVRARGNAGFGLWQLAYGSTDDLTADNYKAARAAMMGVTADYGRKLNISPTHLFCGPSNEEAGRTILNAERDAAGATNVWRGTAELVVTSYLD